MSGRLPVSVCVVNYNGRTYLPETLEAIRRSSPAPAEVLLVDNGSTDGSFALAPAHLPGVRILRLSSNRGPGAARNVGCREASFDRIFFLDNDVRPEPDCLGVLHAALDRAQSALCVMPQVRHDVDGGPVQFDGVAAHLLGMNVLLGEGRDPATLRTRCREAGSLVSAAFLFDRRRWGAEPPFDEALFIYFEDHEFGLRARLLGHRIYVEPRAVCRHREGTIGLSLRATGEYRPARIRQSILNRWQLLWKLYRIRTLLLYLPSFALFEIMQFVGAMTRGWGRHYFHALYTLLGMRGELVARRREFQKRRVRDELPLLDIRPLPFNPALARGRLDLGAQRLLAAALFLNDGLVRSMLGPKRFLRRPVGSACDD